MRIAFQDQSGSNITTLLYPHLDYSDPEVRYQIGKLRASLDLLNEKGERDAESKKPYFPGLCDPSTFQSER